MGNEIDSSTGLIKPQGKKGRSKADEAGDFQNVHWDLGSYVKKNWQNNADIIEDYKAYYVNLKKYHNLVEPGVRTRPLFHFLCFILNDRHRNRTICSHYGSRFYMLLLLEVILAFGIQPQILPQGQGILQLVVKEWRILFLDSFKYFPSSLSSLSQRFNLPVIKGYFSFQSNIPENWGRIRKQPPPLSSYLQDRDSEKAKSEKKKWWEEVKCKQPEFSLNQDIVKYCRADVHLLMQACTKFLHQTMDFGQQLISKFGLSPSFKPGLCQPHFHPFNHGIPTLGSYS